MRGLLRLRSRGVEGIQLACSAVDAGRGWSQPWRKHGESWAAEEGHGREHEVAVLRGMAKDLVLTRERRKPGSEVLCAGSGWRDAPASALTTDKEALLRGEVAPVLFKRSPEKKKAGLGYAQGEEGLSLIHI